MRVGVLCPDLGTTLPAWQARCLSRLFAVDRIEAALKIVETPPADPGSATGPARGVRPFAGLLGRLFHAFANRRARALRPTLVEPLLGQLPTVSLPAGRHPPATGDEIVAAIRSADLDLILHFGRNVVPDDVASLPRYGTWAFDFDEKASAGIRIGFWEVYHRVAVTRASLRRLLPPDAEVILSEGFFKTAMYSYPRTRDTVLLGVAEWPARVCRQLLANAMLPAVARSRPTSTGQSATNRQVVLLLLRSAARFVVAAVATLLRVDHWNVGIVAEPIATFLRPEAEVPIHWLPEPPRGWYVADPFAPSCGLESGLLVEAFDYRSGKGRIAIVNARDSTAVPEPVIAEPIHLSYPFLLEHEGAIYCVPDTHQARAVHLYQATAFPRQWVRRATLIEGFAGIDASIVRHDGLWWLFCSEHEELPNHTLYVWYAEDLTGPWTRHVANPVKVDVRSSRPAGTPFVHEGRLYRPAQDCSRTYGGAVAINHVSRLTPTEYHEEVRSVIEPDVTGPYPRGFHTLSACGQCTLVDGMRRRFIWEMGWSMPFFVVERSMAARRRRTGARGREPALRQRLVQLRRRP